MKANNKIIRDFLYLDVDRLYSLSSQVFEGVAAHIVESFQSDNTKTTEVKGTFGKRIGEEVAEAALRTENKILYDHLYNLLEDSLKSVIIEPINLTKNNYRNILAKTYLVKVRGSIKISDYARLMHFLDNFNNIGFSLAYLQSASAEFLQYFTQIVEEIRLLSEKLATTEDAEEKSHIEISYCSLS